MSFNEDFTFTRGTGATRINAAGLIVGVDFSATSNTIGTGAKTFTLTADANVDRDWPVGSAVRVVDQVSANTMEGTVTTYTPSTQALVLDITSVTGSGTFTNWRIGSLAVRRDADGVLREPMRSNILFPSEPLAVDYVSTGSLVGTGNRIVIFDATAANFGMSKGVRLCRIIPATTLDQNGRNGLGAVNFGGVMISRGTLAGSVDFFSVIINPSTWTNDINVCALGDNNTAGPNGNSSGTLLFNNGLYVGPAGGAADLGGGDFLVRLQVPTATPGANPAGLTFYTTTPGDGIKGWLIGGYQVEQATRAATSYIPTTTVAVTRNADTFTFTPAAIAKFRQGQGALIVEANASDAGTAQRAALRLTGPAGEIRLGKQGVATSGNFTKMAEGGDVQLLGNATQGVTNNGLEYALVNPTRSDTGVALGAANLNAGAYNGSSEFGSLAFTSSEVTLNSTLGTIDFKGMNPGHVLNGAHHNGSRFIVATGGVGAVVLSTDGLSYRRVNTPVITQACNEVTSGMVGPTLRNVIVGAAGFIATSDDNGETWTARTSGTAVAVNGVTRSTTNFIVVLQAATIATNIRTSSDGITWNSVANSGITQTLRDVHANGAQVVAVGSVGSITVSNDNGATWATSPSSGVVTTQALNGVHYNASAGLWVAVGDNGTIVTATDPTSTWTLQTSGTTAQLFEVNYFNGLWVAVGLNQTVLTSPNATSWTSRTANITASIIGIAASGTRLIITGSSGALASSEDGLSYNSRTNNNATLNGIAYGAGVYVSVGNNVNGSGYIATIDGAGTVTRRVSPINSLLVDVKYLNGAFFASHGVGAGGTIRSTDGISWVDIQNARAAANRTSAFGSGIYLFAGSFATYNISSNGTSITSNGLTSLSAGNVNSVDFANGVFVLVGDGGRIATTTDGITYNSRTSGTTQNLTSVMYSTRDQRWYAAGNAGTLLYSEDNGVTWASVNNAGFGAVSNTTLQTSKLLPQWKSGRNTMALSYAANNVIVGLNGVAVTDTSSTIPSITAGVLGESFNGKIGPVYFYEFPKTLEEIKAITGVTR